jgi:hypothetical protein
MKISPAMAQLNTLHKQWGQTKRKRYKISPALEQVCVVESRFLVFKHAKPDVATTNRRENRRKGEECGKKLQTGDAPRLP